MSWKEKIEFLMEPSEAVEVDIKGRTLRFYPLSVQSVFALHNLTGAVSRFLAALFRDSSKDVAQERKSEGDKVEVRIQAIDPELAAKIDQERREAIAGLLELLVNQDTASTIGLLLLDSLRDLRPEGKYGRSEALEFVRSLDLVTLKEMLLGLAKANGGLLDPLADALRVVSPEAEAPEVQA